jgi:hypothetical protein
MCFGRVKEQIVVAVQVKAPCNPIENSAVTFVAANS